MATPYQKVAKAALINWNGLTEEEATNKIEAESVEELEGQVYAMGSMKYAVIGIAKQIGLSEEETLEFYQAVIYGPEDALIFEKVSKMVKGFTEDQKLEVLATIHDGWVLSNASEKTFNKKFDRRQLRQYAPLDLIGWNEVRSDLLFLTPVLESIGLTVDEEILSEVYHARVAEYLEKSGINSDEDLTALVSQGRKYYLALPEELEARLLPLSEMVSSQIVENWSSKDSQTAQIYIARKTNKIAKK